MQANFSRLKQELHAELLLFTRVEGSCKVWTRARTKDGYGYLIVKAKFRPLVKSKYWKAHRLIYYLECEDFDESLYTLHKCDNPPCIEGGHLFQGTQDVNMKDAKAKGRIRKGEDSGRAILTQEDVDYIRSCFSNGKAPYGTMKALARELNVSYSTINFIKRNLSWKG